MLARHATERSVTSLDADYSRVATLGDYFPEATVTNFDPLDPTSGEELGDPERGVGVGQSGRNRQDRLVVTPGFSFDLTERQRLELEVEYLDVTYDKQVPGDRVDYDNLLISAGYRFALTETSSVTVQGGFATYDPADADSTDVQGLNAEWRNELSDTAEVYARAGANRVESLTNNGGSSWDTGFSGGAGVRWAFEVSDVWLDASTSLDPNSSGDIVTRDQLRLQFTRRLGPMTRLTLAGRVIQDTGAGDAQDTFDDRTYATATRVSTGVLRSSGRHSGPTATNGANMMAPSRMRNQMQSILASFGNRIAGDRRAELARSAKTTFGGVVPWNLTMQ
jgi:hypothetical protein